MDELMFARTDTATGGEHFVKTMLCIDRLARPNLRSGPTFMQAQWALYGRDEDGVRHSDIMLRRVTRGLSEARIVEEIWESERAEIQDAAVNRLPANRPARAP